MKNLKIRTSIALLLLMPVVGLLFFSASMLVDKRRTAAEMEGLENLAKLAPVISAMVNELQVERGLAAVYIASKGKRFKAEYPAKFESTDAHADELIRALRGYDASVFNTARIADQTPADGADDAQAPAAQADADEQGPKLIALAKGVSNPLVEQMNRAIVALHGIEKIRTLTQRRFAKVLKLSDIYGTAIGELLGIIEQMAALSTDSQAAKAIIAYTGFLQAKENAGLERVIGGAGFSAKRFKFFLYTRFIELIARQETLLETFRSNAAAEHVRNLEETLVGPEVEAVDNMRAVAIATYQPDFDLQGITLDAWDNAVSAKIELMKTVEDRLSADLIALVDHIRVSAEGAFTKLLTISLVLLAVTFVFVVFVVRNITKPIGEMVGTMNQLADGDLEVEVPARGRSNEVGQMADAVQMFKDNAIRNKQMEAEAEAQQHKAEEEKRQLMLKMADDFESSVGGVVESVSSASTEMQSSAQALSATAEQTSQQSATVAAASEEASTNVQTVASASEELSSSISEISRQVAQSTQIAGAAVAEVDGANQKVQGLADAANRIGEVVALITDIADQTNLLALNATIEAARAGEAGKGFAVVASEVKNLANQTARATEEIANQIGGIQGATQDAVQAIQSIGGTINQMNEIASTIASAVEEQGAATQEIARNVEQAAAGTSNVTSHITGVNQAADETGQSADQLLSAATELSQQSELLRGEVDTFLANIRRG